MHGYPNVPSREDALTVSCPSCGAQPDHPCRNGLLTHNARFYHYVDELRDLDRRADEE